MKDLDKRKNILEEAIAHLKPEDQERHRKRFEQEVKLTELTTTRIRSKFLTLDEAREHQALLRNQGLPINGWPINKEE